jgi:hypothetical protein
MGSKSGKNNLKLFALTVVLFFPTLAHADIIWPELALVATKTTTIILIFAGFLIEWPFIKWVTQLSWSKAIIPLVICNLVSATVGVIIIALGGLIFQFALHLIYQLMGLHNIGTFNPFGIAAATLFVAAITALVEYGVLILWFKTKKSLKNYGILLIGQALSVTLVTMQMTGVLNLGITYFKF